jgi:hypothetical protein
MVVRLPLDDFYFPTFSAPFSVKEDGPRTGLCRCVRAFGLDNPFLTQLVRIFDEPCSQILDRPLTTFLCRSFLKS